MGEGPADEDGSDVHRRLHQHSEEEVGQVGVGTRTENKIK